MSNSLTLKPRMSEKAYAVSQLTNTYVFVVPLESNKLTIAQAVTSQFNVTVVNVKIVVVKGKPVRTARKGGRGVPGRRSNFKKAYVTLAQGDHLPFFDSPEEEVKPAKKSAKTTKTTKKETV